MFRENTRLRKDNSQLKAQIQVINSELCQNNDFAQDTEIKLRGVEEIDEACNSDVNNESDTLSKISLFMSIFRGRNDVYAKRWENQTCLFLAMDFDEADWKSDISIVKDGHHPILFMHCGPIRYRDNPKKQAEKRPFDHYIVPRFTSLRVPLDMDEKDVSIQQLYTEIMESDFRNQQIIDAGMP